MNITADFLLVRDFTRDVVTLSFDESEGIDERRQAFLRERAPVAVDAAMRLLGSLFVNIERIATALDGKEDES